MLNYWASYDLLRGNYKLFIGKRGKEMTEDPFQLKDKVVAITGASSGFGYHFAQVLAQKGAKLVIGARRKDKLEQCVR